MSQKSSTTTNINNNNKQFLDWIVPGSTDFYSSSFTSFNSIKSTNSISSIGLTNSVKKSMAGKMDDQDIHLLEGEMISKDGFSSGIDQTSFDTLDEPVRVTLLRDLQSVASKMKYILFPISRTEIRKHFLRDWDLWGPLLLCTFMALFLHHYSHDDDDHMKKSGPQLSELFGLIWFGSYIVSINFKMLAVSPNPRRRISNTKTICPSIFQLLCVFGYCLSPPCVGLLFLNIFKFIFDSDTLFIIKLAIGSTICFAWPTLSCYKILSQFQDKDKITLAFYPIALFYFVVSWIIITSH
ncbi:protein YIPF6-like [Panonychus citri]|uniref:protein YIPF6-like n=1 Tax=Panonychus citri TaxID=50023 RepID=UPI002307998A|nr:protein YIPF6-like [Panonychus citri]